MKMRISAGLVLALPYCPEKASDKGDFDADHPERRS